jgi:cyclic pyranopterin phosphate synthase
MVDISDKVITSRMAKAQSRIQFPPEMRSHVRDGELYLKKGPVFQTAIIAGTMAVKKTYDVIPFCHQIPIESCVFDIALSPNLICTVTCTVKTQFKTGVEMEALHGAMVASLTIYDMCKALSHNIAIQDTRLIAKTGGKRTVLGRPLYGLVLTGGKSSRMNRDKALIDYHGKPHAQYIYDEMSVVCERSFISAKPGQWTGTPLDTIPTIEDRPEEGASGPIAGILAAFATHPDVDWMIVACDLVYFNRDVAKILVDQCDEDAVATCFANNEKNFPEALCGIYTPAAQKVFREAVANDMRCPVKVLAQSNCRLLDLSPNINLANINTPQEYAEVYHEHH